MINVKKLNLFGESSILIDGTPLPHGCTISQSGSKLISSGGCGPVRTLDSSDDIGEFDFLIRSSVTITLPAVSSMCSKHLLITNTTDSTISVICAGSDTFFRGKTTDKTKVKLTNEGEFIQLTSNGLDGWFVISTGDSSLKFS